MLPTISICIPTRGEPSLRATLAALRPQLREGDQVILVSDGPNDEVRRLAETVIGGEYHICPTPPERENPCGQDQRNYALDQRLAHGDLLMWMGSDDCHTPGSLDRVRAAALENPGRPLLFRMVAFWGGIVWHTRGSLAVGNVSDQIAVFPNEPSKLARFGLYYQGDQEYVAETAEKFGGPESVVFREEIICVCRPTNLLAVRLEEAK